MFSDANLFPDAAVMIHNGEEISDERKSELKGIYLEGLIRFLEIYANDEIGGDVEIDITKIALLVNSPSFENDDLYSYNNIEDIFKLLENLAIMGLPIWRFLKIGEYQMNMLERSYDKLREENLLKIAKQKSCFGCIWFENIDTPFGKLERCKKPNCVDRFRHTRDYFDGVDQAKGCEWLTTLYDIPEKALNKKDDFTKRQFLRDVEYAREHFRKEMQKDMFRIPKELSKEDNISLHEFYDIWEDLALAFGNKRGKAERQNELRKAMFVEGMIRFFEIYAKMEMGNNYVANIKEISIYIDDLFIENKEELKKIKTNEDVYAYLENMILNGFEITRFVKINYDL